jgi:hypothetical protein
MPSGALRTKDYARSAPIRPSRARITIDGRMAIFMDVHWCNSIPFEGRSELTWNRGKMRENALHEDGKDHKAQFIATNIRDYHITISIIALIAIIYHGLKLRPLI